MGNTILAGGLCRSITLPTSHGFRPVGTFFLTMNYVGILQRIFLQPLREYFLPNSNFGESFFSNTEVKFTTIPHLSFLGNLLALPRGWDIIWGAATLVVGAGNSKSRKRNFTCKESGNSFTSLHYCRWHLIIS